MSTTEPLPQGLSLVHEHGRSLRVAHGGVELLRYVHHPWDAQRESPRPYFHPLRTLAGDPVSTYRPHDHVWHKGIAWSLPNVGPANLWGGPTFTRDRGYEQLDNDGSMQHEGFDVLEAAPDAVRVGERLRWVTQQGATWFTEQRSFEVAAAPAQGAWTLVFTTAFTNVSGDVVVMGSPTTQGRPDAGYGGLFWRGPRSFTGGRVRVPGGEGGDELMGVRVPWMGFTGRHDDSERSSTLVVVDAGDNPGHPVQWFVRSQPFACLCPAPFFAQEVAMADGDALALRYAVVVADGDPDAAGVEALAALGRAALDRAAR